MIKKGHLTIKEDIDVTPLNYNRLNPPNHPFNRGVNKKSIADNNILSNMKNNNSLNSNVKSALPRRRTVVKYGFKKLVYMRSIASPEITELLKKDNIINPIHFIKNYLHNLHKLFRGRIQDDLSWKSGTWDDKIARIIKNDAPHRILTKAEVNQIYMVLDLTIADFDDVCLHLGFTTQLTPSQIDMFNNNSQLEYESLYGKFSKSCRPNLLHVYYDYIKYAQAHFATHSWHL